MTEEENELMKRYGITAEQKTVYHYMNFRYDHLNDALNYARIDQERTATEGKPKA
jgi:hypothetical protein